MRIVIFGKEAQLDGISHHVPPEKFMISLLIIFPTWTVLKLYFELIPSSFLLETKILSAKGSNFLFALPIIKLFS